MNGNPAAGDRRFVRWSVLLSVLLALALVAGVWLYAQQRPRMMAEAARDAAFEERYADMHTALEKLENLSQPDWYYQAVLTCAEIADYHGRHDLALELLDMPHADEAAFAAYAEKAQEQITLYSYHQALALYEAGDYARAARAAAQLRDYEPAQKLYEMAQSAYQASVATPTPSATPAPTPVPAETPAAQVQPQDDAALLPEGRLAAGFEHTVVLLADGTVCAFGDNSHGQLNVQSWQNVVYVAAGAYHTLGLTSDGRVLACGDNTHFQTDVSFYSGVKAIACGDYASFLLLEGGQVMATGYLTYDFLNDLSGAEAIWAGSYGLLVKTPDGLHASHPGLALDGNCAQAAVSRGYAVGVDDAGAVCSTTHLIPQWSGVKRLAAGENAVLALAEDGQVLAHSFDSHSRCSFQFDQPVLAVAAGPNHYAFILSDGTLEIRTSDGGAENHALD